jgi:hypothetical protein
MAKITPGTKLMITPATAYFFASSLKSPMMLKTSAVSIAGTDSKMRIPNRNPSGEPQPGCSTHVSNQNSNQQAQGTSERYNPIFPIRMALSSQGSI